MAETNHKTKECNIYTAEFKSKLRDLINKGDFKREILFNGGSKDYTLLDFEEQEKLSRKFKSFVNDNIISLMNDEIEFILNCDTSMEYQCKPFSWDDVLNMNQYDDERIINDIEQGFKTCYMDRTENTTEDCLDYIKTALNSEDITLFENLTYKQMSDELNKQLNLLSFTELHEIVDEYYDELCIQDLMDYELDVEVMQWFLVSGWLCDKLNDNHEIVIDSHNYWGRSCCGQSIELDSVVQNIFLDSWTREY